MTDDQLTLFLITAPHGEREHRASLVMERLELDPAEFKAWLRARTARQLRLTLREADDEDLIHLYQTFEDHDAFTELMRRHDPFIRNIMYRFFKNPDTQDEVMQLYRCSMLEAINRFTFNSKFRTYAYRVAWNEALMHLRSIRRSREDADDVALLAVPADHQPHADHTIRRRIRQAVAQLPEPLRHAFEARHFRHMNVKEGAEHLQITPGLFRQRIHRAKLHMRELLKDVAPGA